MNELIGKTCDLCGGTVLKKEVIPTGYLLIGDKLFKIKNYPGYRCSDCKEEYIKKDTKEMFIQFLSKGNYEAVEETTIPVYDFGDSEEVKEKRLMHRVGPDGRVYCIDNTPVISDKNTNIKLKSKTYQHLVELHKRIINGEENKVRETLMITVIAQ